MWGEGSRDARTAAKKDSDFSLDQTQQELDQTQQEQDNIKARPDAQDALERLTKLDADIEARNGELPMDNNTTCGWIARATPS